MCASRMSPCGKAVRSTAAAGTRIWWNACVCHFVELNGCTLDANNVTYDSVYARASHVFLYNTGLYNALQGVEAYLATANVKDCKGSCSWAMISYASVIIASGTVPNGSRGTGEERPAFRKRRYGGLRHGHSCGRPGQHDHPVRHPHEVLSRRLALGYRGRDPGGLLRQRLQVQPELELRLHVVWQPAQRALRYDDQVGDPYAVPQDGQRLQLCQNALPVRHHQHHGQRRAFHRGKLRGHRGPLAARSRRRSPFRLRAVQGLANGTYGGLCLYESKYNFGSSNWSNNYMRMAGTDSSYKPYLQVVYNSGGSAVG